MLIEIHDISIEELKMFSSLTDAGLRASWEAECGIFIAESPKVIRVALTHGYEPVALLCERKHLQGDAADIVEKFGDNIPIYTGEREVLSKLTGYVLTRGVLCAMKRKMLPSVTQIVSGCRIIAVLQSITDTTNIGAIFRSASALGVDAVILSSDTCDPLNRRAIRVSMGTVFTVPWTFDATPVSTLKALGFTTAALALNDNSISLDNPILSQIDRLAVIFGTEGDGLPFRTITECEYVVKIPMQHGVDSLNVAAAAAVTFWQLRR
ncbi:MAG: RNA methyltransferase [Muribaculaceae bacterium]|nr:RNA methyltransferase [Muribaculaceae bacterium]